MRGPAGPAFHHFCTCSTVLLYYCTCTTVPVLLYYCTNVPVRWPCSLDVPEVATAIIDCFIGEPERTRAGRFSSFALDGREFFYSCLGTPCGMV